MKADKLEEKLDGILKSVQMSIHNELDGDDTEKEVRKSDYYKQDRSDAIEDIKEAIQSLIEAEVKKARVYELKRILDITSKGGRYETDLILGVVVKDRLAELTGEGK